MAIYFCQKAIFLSESPKVINRTLQLFCKKIFNSRISYGNDACSFDSPVNKHSTKSRRFFAQCPKKMGEKLKEDTSQNNLFARWNAVLTIQSKNFRTKVKTFRSMSEQENVKFSSESFSATSFLCTPGKQSWQKAETFRSMSEFDKKIP